MRGVPRRSFVLSVLGGLLCASGAPGGRPLRPSVRVLSSLETVRTRDTPGGTGHALLEAARGEWESFQLVVHAGERGLTALTVRAEPLRGPGGTALQPAVSRVGFVEVRAPSNAEGAVGPWPDPLVPTVDAFDGQRRLAFPVRAAPGEDVAAWIDVYVPREAPPGRYRGALRVEEGGVPLARVPVVVEVRRFTLPATSSLPVTFGFYARTAARAHYGREASDDEALELTRRYALAALRERVSVHGGTVDPPPFRVEDAEAASPTVRLDTDRYDREVGPFLDGTADPGGPARGARWTAFDLRVPWKLSGSVRAAYVRALAQHLTARGWIDRVFDYTADEPAEAQLDGVRARAQAVRAAAPGIPRLVTRTPDPRLDGAVDIWCPLVNLVEEKPGGPELHMPPMEASFAARASRGERLWWYQSCLSHGCERPGSGWYTGWPSLVVDSPPVGQRIFEWLSFRRGVRGELYYNTVEAYDGDPWRDLYRHGGNGDGTLFYPGRPDRIGGTSHIPVESIRLKRIRDGLEDYEYLTLLSQLGGAREAERIARRIAPRAWRWDHDPGHLLAARAELARAIDRLLPRRASR